MREEQQGTRRASVRWSRSLPRPATVVAVALGGAIGAPVRYELGQHLVVAPGSFPWVTFGINVSGSLLLGLLLVFVLERWPPTRYVRPFLAIGVLGAYTTFSTYSVEADLLFKDGHVAVGVVYVLSSLIGGLAAVFLGIIGGRAWPRLRRSRS
jgi:CrcB protein